MSRSVPCLLVVALAFGAVPAHADPGKCQRTIINVLRKFKKTHLKLRTKCLDAQNVGKIAGSCPDQETSTRLINAHDIAAVKIAGGCSGADLASLGYTGSCNFEPGAQGVEADCTAMPANTPAELALCLLCWKQAELAEFVAILYASHAMEVCNGNLGDTSNVCSDLDCSTPLPDQRDLGDTREGDCQKAVGRNGMKYLLTREKLLEKCGLSAGTQATCLGSLKIQTSLDKAEAKMANGIRKKCGNVTPVASPSFCCKGAGNSCTVPAPNTREQCVTDGGQVQEDKFCDSGSCSPIGGPKPFTWWETCPEASCGAQPLATLEDAMNCIITSADAITDELLCMQFPSGWPCPPPGSPSGAFL